MSREIGLLQGSRHRLALARLRPALGRTWLIVLFAAVYAVSQVTILVILHPLGSSIAELQTQAFTAAKYVEIFREWEEAGLMPAYRAHFILDDVHWIWYAGLFTCLLCRLFERRGVAHRFDWLLLLPLAAGLLDAYENHLQHVFLSTPDFSTIVDPLPLFSTLASDLKWLLALAFVALTLALALGANVLGARRTREPG
jgi:hypothetical protein